MSQGLSFEPVRWGSLGCARVLGRRMVPGFASVSGVATLYGVASRDESKARAFAEAHGVERAYGSYEALLSDPDIEAVYIPLPNDQHVPYALEAIKQGKHVLIDKPAALNYADAVRVANAATEANVRLLEGFMCRYHPQHKIVQEAISAGQMGDLAQVRSQFSYPAVRDVNTIRWKPEQGGGALLDVCVYPINAARLYLGEPVAVCASAVWDKTGVDTRMTVLLEFADGATASLLGGFDLPFTSRYEVWGTQGYAVAERAFQIGENGVHIHLHTGDTTRTEFIPHTDQYGLEIARFSRAVRDPKVTLAPGENGVEQARVVEAVYRSARENRRVLLEEITA